MRSVAASALAVALGLAVLAPTSAEAQIRRQNQASATIAGVQPHIAAAQVNRPVTFAAQPGAETGTLILPLSSEGELATRAASLDPAVLQSVQRALTSANFRYGARQTLTLRGLGGWDRIVIVGLGANPSMADVQGAGAAAGRMLHTDSAPATLWVGGLPADQAAEFLTGFGLGEYRSDLHRTTGREQASPGPLTVVGGEAARAEFERRGRALVEAMAWTRDISNEPANIVYPESFVERARQAFAGVRGVTIEVLDVPQMERLGMGALLSVGQGSARPSRLMAIRYQGPGAPEGGPIALVGKGITFDTGGISIKPGAGMGNMKMDMSGAASVTGAVLALAKSGAPVDVIAVAALAENMPSATASRPADVVTAMNGKTIEIISTDAEGRMVLSDALVWTENTFNPSVVVDVATLTGSVGGALGSEYAGLFTRHDAMADQLQRAGLATGEPLWRLPLHPSYARYLSSSIADLRNTGDGGAGAGTGAWFIGEFVRPETPWAHLDIASAAYGGASDVRPSGSYGYAVRLLERFVLDWTPVARERGAGGY